MKLPRALGSLLVGGVGLLFLGLVWSVGIEPRLIDENPESARIPNLPPAWEGRRIALVADLQVGMWLDNTDTIRRIVARLVERRPAAVLVAGDFVYNPSNDEAAAAEREDTLEFRDSIAEVTDLLRPLGQAGIPVYAVLGNHDYGMPTTAYARNDRLARELRGALQGIGIRVLDNEAVPLPADGSPEDALYVVGVGDLVAGDSRPLVALAGVPTDAPRIALMHNPHSFSSFPPGSAPLALAGHTHGGQLRIPFTPDWSWMELIREEEIFADGWFDAAGDDTSRLYVNRGIGFSVFPARLNCLPELTLITLHGASAR